MAIWLVTVSTTPLDASPTLVLNLSEASRCGFTSPTRLTDRPIRHERVVIAGVVAELAGLRVALAMGFAIFFAGGLVLLHPAIRTLREMPGEVAATDTDA